MIAIYMKTLKFSNYKLKMNFKIFAIDYIKITYRNS